MTTITLSGGAAMTTTQKTALRVEIGATSAADVTAAANAAQTAAEGTAGTALAGHVAATDPHPQYLTQTEGDGRYAPAGISGATNLTATASPTGVTINSDTGTDAAIPLADPTNAGVMAPAQVTKLAGIASDATANAADAALRDRATHTGTQPTSTITGLDAALAGKATAAQGAKADTALQPGALPAGTTLPAAQVSDSSASGRTVMTGTAAAGLAALGGLGNSAGAIATTLENAGTTAPADLARIQASVSGGGITGTQLNPDGAYALLDAIASPLEIGSCALWLDAGRGPMKSDWSACAADGDAVVNWPDLSGNARHATVQAGSPTYKPAGSRNGRQAVKIGANCRMVTPAFVTSGFGNAITIFIVSAADATLHSSLKIKASISTASFWIGNTGTTGARDCTINGLTGFSQIALNQPTLDGIDCISVGASSVRHLIDGFSALVSSSNASMKTAISAGAVPFTNGAVCIGGLSGTATYDWPGTISEVVIFNKELTDSEFRRVHAYLAAKWESMPLLQLVGNSLTSGTGSTGGPGQTIGPAGTNLPSLMWAALAGVARVRIDAYPGRTTTQIFNETQAYSGLTSPTTPRTITHVWEITNSMASSGAPWQAYEEIARACRAKKRTGNKVIVGTCLYRGDTGNDAKNAALTNQVNALIRANYQTFANAIVDYAADSRLQTFTNTMYFNADKIHLTDAGHAVCRDLLLPVVQAQISAP